MSGFYETKPNRLIGTLPSWRRAMLRSGESINIALLAEGEATPPRWCWSFNFKRKTCISRFTSPGRVREPRLKVAQARVASDKNVQPSRFPTTLEREMLSPAVRACIV